ncbi:HET-domain-containing protein, partial [Glonium stellatum]
STQSPESWEQANHWLKRCMQDHVYCKLYSPKLAFLPTRLIEIWGYYDDEPQIRLRNADMLGSPVPYATLSHCWGSWMPFKLTRSNLMSCMESIPLKELSKVFQDAISVTLRAEIRYIWIDSLCIIQDSIKDWRAESTVMGLIYHYSILNIAATGFPDGSKGLFAQRDAKALMPIAIVIKEDKVVTDTIGKRETEVSQGNYMLLDAQTWKDSVDDAPLGKRGWAVQERSLSVRTLHFSAKQLYWECVSLKACEIFPKGFAKGTLQHFPKFLLYPRTREYTGARGKLLRKEMEEFGIGGLANDEAHLGPHPVMGMTTAQQQWSTIVEIYSRCALSFSKDKLVAICGMAKLLSKDMDCKYLAGMWRKDLEHQLLWRVVQPMPAVKKDGTRGPSWSWTSVDGQVETSHIKWLARVAEVKTNLVGDDEFGQVSSGTLTLTG